MKMQQMNSENGSLWRCQKCDTVNRNTNYCRVCKYPRVDPFARPPVIRQPQEDNSRKKLVYAIIIAISILAAVFAVGAVYFVTSGHVVIKDSAQTEVSAEAEDEDKDTGETNAESKQDTKDDSIYYVINTKSDGLNIRSGPGKGYTSIEMIGYGDTSITMKDLGSDEEDEYGYIWHKVELSDSGKVGYVRNDVVKKQSK